MIHSGQTRLVELWIMLKKKKSRCAVKLVPCFRLDETTQNLQQTREKLSQEEFICSELTSAQEHLYTTAGQVPAADLQPCSNISWLCLLFDLMCLLFASFQLLSAAETSTRDVSRLHDKLDRKTKVAI